MNKVKTSPQMIQKENTAFGLQSLLDLTFKKNKNLSILSPLNLFCEYKIGYCVLVTISAGIILKVWSKTPLQPVGVSKGHR